MTLDVARVKQDFPILAQRQDDKPLVFLDSAASSQRPNQVLEAMTSFAQSDYANVHRGVYQLAERATNRFEAARTAVASFIGASKPNEVIFTKNATEALNLVAQSWGRANLGPGDAVVLSLMEHHANIVPWQMLATELGFEIRWIEIDDDYNLDLSNLDQLLEGAKLLAFSQMSNVLGTIAPTEVLVDAARKAGALVLLDACQSVPHAVTNVVEADVDFIAFSGHKMLGPTGIGVLWGREHLLEEMPPFLGGGGMILNVTREGFSTAELPAKFEAGTPPIIEAVGLHAAIDYLNDLGMEAVAAHEHELTKYALKTLPDIVGEPLRIYGPSQASGRGAVFSIGIETVHAHDISQILDQHAVCIRPGHHCAKPLMKKMGVSATARASLYIYNDTADVDALGAALAASNDFFAL